VLLQAVGDFANTTVAHFAGLSALLLGFYYQSPKAIKPQTHLPPRRGSLCETFRSHDWQEIFCLFSILGIRAEISGQGGPF
jgi:hypothetical protein